MERIEKQFACVVAVCFVLTLILFWVVFLSGSCVPTVEPEKTEIPAETETEAPAPVLDQIIAAEPVPEEIPQAVEPEVQSLGTFKLTAYCACPKCCGKWADGITYTGTVATPDRTVAVDPSVIPLGSTIYVNGQTYVAEDIGGAIKGNRIDVFFPSHTEALHFGVQYAEVTMLQNNP